MNFDWLVLPTLALALVLFCVGERLGSRNAGRITRFFLLLGSFVLAIPACLIALYYFHWFDNAKWFYEFRAFPCSELSASGGGLFVGVIIGCTTRWFRWCRIVVGALLFGSLCIAITLPYLKPILWPVSPSQFSNQWRQDVCLQSMGSSCGAASTATILKALGIEVTEAEIARECFTYVGGTESWFLARAFSKRGCDVRFRLENGFPADLHLPAIAGVNVGCGHFITILSKTETTYVTGDPLGGRQEYPKNVMSDTYRFTGFLMEIRKKD